MLKMLSKILDEKKLNYVFINGSIHVVASKIKKFKTDKSVKIVLMSSDKSPSGLNLTEANHLQGLYLLK